jgi:hypothetical protein
MAEKKAFHKSKRFYVLSAILLILFTAGFLFWRNYKYKLVNKKLDSLISVKSKGLYQLSYKNLIIDEALGNVSAENVEMIPDSLVYQTLVDQKTAPDNLFIIRIPKLEITGVITPKALLNKEISAHIIKIINANVEIRLGNGKKPAESGFSSGMRSDLYRVILGKLNSIKTDSLVLENAGLTLSDMKSKEIRVATTGLSVRFSGVLIDSAHQNDSSRFLFSKDLAVHCDRLEFPLKNEFYNLEVRGVDFNTLSRLFHTDKIFMKPLLSETEFARAHKFAVDRLDIRIRSLDIQHVNLQELLTGQLIADTITISDASLHDFRDKSYPHDSADRTNNYPQQAIMKLPFSVYVSKILIRDSYIEYKEKNDRSDSSGKISFFHIQADFDNVTNMLVHIKTNNRMLLHFNAVFLDEAPFHTDITMKLNDKRGIFQMDAKLGEINAVSLNPLLKPMALAEVKKGKISSLRYHLAATNTSAHGKLLLIYDDLSLRLLKKDDDNNKYKTKFFSTLAAGLVLKESNPKNGKTRIGEIDYDRDINRSIFNLMWKSLFTAIKNVAI